MDMFVKVMAAMFGMAAFMVWLYTVVHFVQAVRARRPEVPLSRFLTQGIQAFNPANFTAEGLRHQRSFVRGFAAFFALVFAGIALGFVLARRTS